MFAKGRRSNGTNDLSQSEKDSVSDLSLEYVSKKPITGSLTMVEKNDLGSREFMLGSLTKHFEAAGAANRDSKVTGFSD